MLKRTNVSWWQGRVQGHTSVAPHALQNWSLERRNARETFTFARDDRGPVLTAGTMGITLLQKAGVPEFRGICFMERTSGEVVCSPNMESIESLIGRLFSRKSAGKVALHHGPLMRSEAFQKERLEAKGTPAHKALHHWLAQGWQAARKDSEGPMRYFTNAQATGVLFMRDRATPDRLFRQLLDDMAEQVAGLGYKRQLADIRVDEAGIQRDRIYLKPWPLGTEAPLQQRYGNITLEQWGPVGKVQGMKVLVTIYQDRLYAPASKASELFDVLFAG